MKKIMTIIDGGRYDTMAWRLKEGVTSIYVESGTGGEYLKLSKDNERLIFINKVKRIPEGLEYLDNYYIAEALPPSKRERLLSRVKY